MANDLNSIHNLLLKKGDQDRALKSQSFFKTGAGGYGAGDKFLGIRVPELRKLAKSFKNLSLEQITELLCSTYHEERHLGLFILVERYKNADSQIREAIYQIYLSKTDYINNWDLVDTSAPYVVGAHLWHKSRSILYELAKSQSLWERRMAILATFYFIRRGDYADTLSIAEILVNDTEDLIHKAVGWMLREIGNRDLQSEETFLKERYQKMPRTMLRYAIEKFPEEKRQDYLKGRI